MGHMPIDGPEGSLAALAPPRHRRAGLRPPEQHQPGRSTRAAPSAPRSRPPAGSRRTTAWRSRCERGVARRTSRRGSAASAPSATTTSTRSTRACTAGGCTPDQVRAWVAQPLLLPVAHPDEGRGLPQPRRGPGPAPRLAPAASTTTTATTTREGGIARWLRSPRRSASTRPTSPPARACCRRPASPSTPTCASCASRRLLEAVAASLTELFAPKIHAERIEGLLKHYAFADDRSARLLPQPPRRGAARRRLRARLRARPRRHARAAGRGAPRRSSSRPTCSGPSSTRSSTPT